MGEAFDAEKDKKNIAKHRISLSRAVDFEPLYFVQDERFDYGEVRFRAWGYIDGRAHCLAYTMRQETVRPISLRPAHEKEMRRYVKATKI